MDRGMRILAENQLISNDTWVTGVNNNDLIIGPSGAGKTRGYVMPNLLQGVGSVVVADTKGSLYGEMGGALESLGCRTVLLDFTDLAGSWGYNPLEYIRRDRRTGRYREQDILTVSACLVPLENERDPFWELSARMYLSSMIGYVLECLPEEEHTLEYVTLLFQEMSGENFDRLFQELGRTDPDSFAYRTYRSYQTNRNSEKTHASIQAVVAERLSVLAFDGARRMYQRRDRVDFRALGRERTAVFLTVSDTDRSMDRLAGLFYTQALHILCDSADRDFPDHRLPVPVRFILDDFATNVFIPDFDKLIAVIRSREIAVSLVIQSITQLYALYGEARSKTIINNCDNCLYLGGQDVDTAQYIGVKANRTAHSILELPLEEAYLFTRGRKPRMVRRYDLRAHPRYRLLPEAGREPGGRPAASEGEENRHEVYDH